MTERPSIVFNNANGTKACHNSITTTAACLRSFLTFISTSEWGTLPRLSCNRNYIPHLTFARDIIIDGYCVSKTSNLPKKICFIWGTRTTMTICSSNL